LAKLYKRKLLLICINPKIQGEKVEWWVGGGRGGEGEVEMPTF